MLPTKFRLILAKQFQRRRFLEIDQSKTKIACGSHCLLMDQNEMSKFYRGPSIDASCQVSYHLAKWFQRKSCFRNRTIRNKNCLWRPCLLTDRNDMKIIIEDLSYILSTKFLFIWPSGFRGEDLFLYWLARNKNCLLRSCVLTARDDMNNLHRRPVMDAFF